MNSERTVQTQVRALWVQKRGSAHEEYEDAYWIGDGDATRIAVADGATEASYSQQWARALVRAFGRGTLHGADFANDIATLRTGWGRAFARHMAQKRLPWFAEQKASLGAFAAFVGIELHCGGVEAGADPAAAERPRWRAVAVGDCNLFQVRGGDLLTAFPLTRSDQFSGGPFLVGSKMATGDDPLARRVQHAEGELHAGDTLFLMSDALAAWFLRTHERGERPWQRLQSLPADDTGEAFAAFITELRDGALLHNDDVTLVTIAVTDAALALVAIAAAPGHDSEVGTPVDPAATAGPAGEQQVEADETTPF